MKFSYDLLKKLTDGVPPKAKLIELMNMHVFEIESDKGDALDIKLPSNRYSDASSHIGIAREIAAVLKEKLHNPVKTIINAPSKKGFLKVEVKEKGMCPRYSARYFEMNKLPVTPTWMKKALASCGIKSINGVVDIMNYVMIETGQPLHVFDADKIQGGIVVRKAEKGEKIETLDGENYALTPEMLVIADKAKAQAIAGIKGGNHSGVTKETKKIIVEAANFDLVHVFKTSKALKLETDASVRFSHGLSPVLVDWGMDRATELLAKSGAKLLDSADIYPKPVGSEIIEFSPERYKKLVGAEVSMSEAERIFISRGFSIHKKKKNSMLVKVPAWRTDISIEEDLIEEIVRLQGINDLLPTAPFASLHPAKEDDLIVLKDRIRNLLVSLRMDEVYNYSFLGEKEPEMLELENPISKDQAYLRRKLEPGILKNIEHNRRFSENIRIFEIGNVYKAGLREHLEETNLALCIANKKKPQVLEMKGIMREVLSGIGLTDFHTKEEGDRLRIESDHKVLGEIKVLHLEKGWVVVLLELNLSKLLDLVEEEKGFRPFSKFPAVVRDVSLLLENHVRIGDVVMLMQEFGGDYVEDIDLIDEYSDPKLGGEQSITLRIVFQAPDRTLTDEEVNKEIEAMLQAVRSKFRVEVR